MTALDHVINEQTWKNTLVDTSEFITEIWASKGLDLRGAKCKRTELFLVVFVKFL